MNDTEKRHPRTFRCTDDVWGTIEHAAKKAGMSASDFVSHAAVNAAQDDAVQQQFILTPKTQDTLVRGLFALVIAKHQELKSEGREDFWQAVLKRAQDMFDEDQNSGSADPIWASEDSENGVD